MQVKRFWNLNDLSVKVKICGIKSLDIAYEASQIRVDALGFHIWKKTDIKYWKVQFKQIVKYLPKDMSCWLVTDITDVSILKEIITEVPFDTIQIQGMVPIIKFYEIVKKLEFFRNKRGIKIIKTISMAQKIYEKVLTNAGNYSTYADAIVLDSKWKGGTGKIHNWDWSAEIVKRIRKPIILAGGLTSDNISIAITKVRPYGVDIETGVEVVVGYCRKKEIKCKSILKIRNFIKKVKNTP